MNIIGHKQLLSGPQTGIKWLVDGLIKAGSIGFIAGEPKTSKSWLALHIAQAVATGTPVLGRFKVPGPARVLFVEEEDAYETVITRFKDLAAGHAIPEPLEDNLNFLIHSGLRVDEPGSIDLFIGAARDLNKAGLCPNLIIFDVLNKLHAGSDTDQKHASDVMRAFERIRKELNCAILIVHHFAKGSPSKRGNQRMRGSSVFAGWSENSLYLTKDGAIVHVEPENKFILAESFSYRFNAVNGGLRLEYLSVEDAILDARPEISARELQRQRDAYKKRHHRGGR